jgi:hypothetical protein
MTMTKYTASYEGRIVGSRVSHRVYSHAIVIHGHGLSPHVVTWCGRPELARAQQAKFAKRGFTAVAVPADTETKP